LKLRVTRPAFRSSSSAPLAGAGTAEAAPEGWPQRAQALDRLLVSGFVKHAKLDDAHEGAVPLEPVLVHQLVKPCSEVIVDGRLNHHSWRFPSLQTAVRFKLAKTKAFESKVGAKMGAKFGWPRQDRKQKAPLCGAFLVAGAGFEPATSGL
jgi:hypothetical protein